jgi:hypothetical protein
MKNGRIVERMKMMKWRKMSWERRTVAEEIENIRRKQSFTWVDPTLSLPPW